MTVQIDTRDLIGVSEFLRRPGAILQEITAGGGIRVIVRNNEPRVVMMSLGRYEDLMALAGLAK